MCRRGPFPKDACPAADEGGLPCICPPARQGPARLCLASYLTRAALLASPDCTACSITCPRKERAAGPWSSAGHVPPPAGTAGWVWFETRGCLAVWSPGVMAFDYSSPGPEHLTARLHRHRPRHSPGHRWAHPRGPALCRRVKHVRLIRRSDRGFCSLL